MRDHAKVAGIILAAGTSTRMGEPKQLLFYKGKPMLANIIEHALKSNLDEVIVVLGYQSEEIRKKIQLDHVNTVLNTDYENGQSTSLKSGIDAVSPNYDGVLFLLCDMPFIDDTIINVVIASYKKTQKDIVTVSCQGRSCHPVLFDRSLFPELKQIPAKDEGARSILKKFPDRIENVSITDDRILRDVDTKDDYLRLQEHY